MRKVCHAIVCCHLIVVLGWTSPVSATTVVAKLEKSRIILAADTRRKAMSSGVANSRDFHDDYCKITALGRVGFAATGYSDHNEKGPAGRGDWNWNASKDAQVSYGLHSRNIIEMADDWRAREIQIFNTLYVLHQGLIKELAGADGATPLLIGLFAGWDIEGRPTLILESIVFYQGPFAFVNQTLTPPPSVLTPISGFRTVLYERALPYSTNNYTESLIEGDPAQSSPTAKKWSAGVKNASASERDWRWLEFLIQSTSTQDEQVGKYADVLEIQESGSRWLHCAACSACRRSQKHVPHP